MPCLHFLRNHFLQNCVMPVDKNLNPTPTCLFEGLRCKSCFTAISQALWAICFRFREAWSLSRVRMIEMSNSSSSGFRYGIPRTLVAWGFRMYLFTLFTLRLLAWVQTPICEESALYLHQLKEHEMLVVFWCLESCWSPFWCVNSRVWAFWRTCCSARDRKKWVTFFNLRVTHSIWGSLIRPHS